LKIPGSERPAENMEVEINEGARFSSPQHEERKSGAPVSTDMKMRSAGSASVPSRAYMPIKALS